MSRATEGLPLQPLAAKFVTSRYYDVVNFARRVKVPGLYPGASTTDVPADVDVLGLQRHPGAQTSDAYLRQGASVDTGASRRRERMAGSRSSRDGTRRRPDDSCCGYFASCGQMTIHGV